MMPYGRVCVCVQAAFPVSLPSQIKLDMESGTLPEVLLL